MATLTVKSSVGDGLRYSLGLKNNIYVKTNILVGSETGTAIHGGGLRHSAQILGDVYGQTFGLDFSNLSATSNRVTVGRFGNVSADLGNFGTALRVLGSGTSVTNNGEVSGNVGVHLGGSRPGGVVTLTNTGTITADTAVYIDTQSKSVVTFKNSGTVAGDSFAYLAGNIEGVDKIYNTGTLLGDVETAGGNDLFVANRGTVSGNIYLGDGADTYLGTGGVLTGDLFLGAGNDTFNGLLADVTGTVDGGDGDDLFMPGLGRETIDGGAGIDTLDFAGSLAVSVALDGSYSNSGRAFSDTYSQIENVAGSNSTDILIGDDQNNTLWGRLGADHLHSLDGDDRLIGGGGRDHLLGGLGNDCFVYESKADLGDDIDDFGATLGDDDCFIFARAAFGGAALGQINAADFQSRADNSAQDTSDRFIFRTTDATLWFDADGSGSKAALLVADLNDDAVLGYQDIYFG